MKQLLLLIALLSVWGCSVDTRSTTTLPLRFGVLSDIHFGRPSAPDKVSRALTQIVGENPVAIFVVGDITTTCTAVEYNQAIEVFKNSVPPNIAVYFMMGNHDRTLDQTGHLFEQKTGQRPNQGVEIGGLPFITLSVEGGVSQVSGTDCYSPQTIEFLAEKLRLSAQGYPNMPIFVFAHIPPSRTVWGTYQGVDDMSSDALLPVLKQYRQVICFSGHTHYPVGDERSIHQRDFTTVNDGSSAYGCTPSDVDTELTDMMRPVGSEQVVEALLVTVQTNFDVEIKRLDTYRGNPIKDKWVIRAPHDGTQFVYTDARKGSTPLWGDQAQVSIDSTWISGCKFSFDQATSLDVVYAYDIKLVNSGTAEVEASYSIFSQFWSGAARPALLSWEAKGLTPLNTYIVQVRPRDSFGNIGAQIVSREFVTQVQ